MSIAYTEPMSAPHSDPSKIFQSSSAVTNLATSALLLVASVGGTTTGVPLFAPLSVVGRPFVDQASGSTADTTTPMTDAELVKWIKDESGLTWDQIARAFDVSRRAVHLWANGGRVSAGNAEALQGFAALVRGAAGAFPSETRNALLTVGSDGLSPIDRSRRTQHAASTSVTGTPFDPAALLGEASGPTSR